MRVTIDNLDGQGATDYTDALTPEEPLTIERHLNKPSTCGCVLRDGASRPVRLGRMAVASDDGTVLFTGYVTREPEAVYAGADHTGGVYRLKVHAVSDDWLLDKQNLRVSGESFSESGNGLLASLTQQVDGSRFTTSTSGSIGRVGRFRTRSEKIWSAMAGAIAEASGASYHVLGGDVTMAALGSTQHLLPPAGEALRAASLRVAHTRELVNDVTISGPLEGGTYVTEVLVGDGTTAEFPLSQTPFRESSPSDRNLVADAFDSAGLDQQRWVLNDPGSHLGVGSGGLLMTGGDGLDGQTTLTARSAVELGGCLLLEAQSVTLHQGSDGVLLGLYSGATSRANCVAGFDVRQNQGATQLGCLADGDRVGASFTLASGHAYSLRIHVHAVEVQRVRQSFLAVLEGVPQQFGGGLVEASLDLLFELQDLGASSNTPAVVLYDGTLIDSPASASFIPVNSVQLQGSIGEISATRSGSLWVQARLNGSTQTRIEGSAGTGADFSVVSGGALRFFSGRIPTAGEQLTVRYRRSRRSVGRVQAPESVQGEAKGGLPGIATWRGSVAAPETQSSQDCAAAAAAILAIAGSRPAALAGTYDDTDLQAVWPGDLLTFRSDADAVTVMARQVRLTDGGTSPELVHCHITFANDWASPTSLELSESFATDAMVPAPGAAASTTMSLAGLRVISVTGTQIQIDTGSAPLPGGGFEIRRNDGGFGPGEGGDLVLRSLVRGLTIPRTAEVERFYVRMYDGSTPPIYSGTSSAVFTTVPVG